MLEAFFSWANRSAAGDMMRDSRYAYPLVEMVHLVGLALVLGSLLLQCSRLLGFGMRRETFAEVTEDLAPWTTRGLILMVASGVLMFSSRAGDLYDFRLEPYLTKISLVIAGVLFYYLVQRRLGLRLGRHMETSSGENESDRIHGWRARAIGLTTLAAFFGAAISALWVEFL